MNRISRLLTTIVSWILLTFLFLEAWAPAYKLYPVDEAPLVPSFLQFREDLQQAVAARDGNRVIAMTHPDLKSKFEVTLRLARSEISGGEEFVYWGALERLLSLGGTFTKKSWRGAQYDTFWRSVIKGPQPTREFCAPYVWSTYPPPNELPPPRNGDDTPWVILGSGVRVRAKPPKDMRVIGRLSYDLVYRESTANVHGGAGPDWICIVTPDGRKGYVSATLIRTPVDYHACFGQFGDTWLITEFGQHYVR